MAEGDLKILKEKVTKVRSQLTCLEVDDKLLARYLRAFRTVDLAYQRLFETDTWRREFGVAGINADLPAVQKNLQAMKGMVLNQRDNEGRPVGYVPARNHNVFQRDLDEMTQFVVYSLELAASKCLPDGHDNVCLIFDLKDFRLSCMDYSLIRTLLWLLNHHYPERMGICLVLNAPMVFSACWTIIKAWMDENTQRKVHFISDSDLSKYLRPEILPLDK